MNEKSNVILINPSVNTPYPQPPLGLASIAAVLERDNISVEIIDANALDITDVEIISRIQNNSIVGISAMTPTFNTALRLAKKIKERCNRVRIIFGGPHPSILAESTLKDSAIDVVIIGEGEYTFLDLYYAFQNKTDLNSVKGIAFRGNDNKIITTERRPPIENLNELPFLAYHLLPLKKYKMHPPHGRERNFMAMLTSRGCPYQCIFCSKTVFGSKIRLQSAKRVVDEIEYLHKKFHIKEIAFYDDIFTITKNRTFEILDEIHKRNLNIVWTCEARVNLIDDELIQRMKNAGCYMISYGIESGNQNILNTLKKNTTLDQIRSAILTTNRNGIECVGYFILGSPGETEASIIDTIEFAKKMPLDFIQFSILIPYPGTEIFNSLSMDNTFNWDDFVYANINNSNTPVFQLGDLTIEELREWNKKAYTEFYLRWGYIFHRIFKIRAISDIQTNFKGILMLFNMIK